MVHKFEVVVPDEQLSLAIGRRGQNVRLASQLTGWDIDILTETDESERRQEELRQRSSIFMASLDIDEMMAQLLATEGFAVVEDVAYVSLEELAGLEGFDEDLAEALQRRASDYLDRRDQELDLERREMGVGDDLAAIEGLTPGMLVRLGEADIKTLDDLGDLASDELTDPFEGVLADFALTKEEANAIIMAARAHWFDDEAPAEPTPESEDDAPSSGAQGEAT